MAVSSNYRYVREHTHIVEVVLGKRLPAGAVIHHVNHDKRDNSHRNLVVCQDQAYHNLLHSLARVRDAGGNPHTDKICHKCRAVKPKTEFSPSVSRGKPVLNSKCKPCACEYQRNRRVEKPNVLVTA